MSDDQAVTNRSKLSERLEQAERQIQSGQYIELDEQGLDRYFAELMIVAEAPGEST